MSLTQQIIKVTTLTLALTAPVKTLAGDPSVGTIFYDKTLGVVILAQNILTIGGPSQFAAMFSMKNQNAVVLKLSGVPTSHVKYDGNGFITIGPVVSKVTIQYSEEKNIFSITLPSGQQITVKLGTETSVAALEELALAQEQTPVTLEP